jgi:enoyl-CoA hydratase/carnithine racemase
MPEYRHWRLAKQDHLATLTLNRPEAKNSLTLETLAELRAVTAELAADRDAWVVVLQGQGEHFCAGFEASISQWIAGQPEPVYRETLREMQRALDDLEALEKPVVARIQGFCISYGLLLALCCDFRVASERSVYWMPEIKLGLGVIAGTQRIVRLTGPAAAKKIILLGERFGSQEALGYRLVHQVVPPEQLDGAVGALAGKLLKLPPRSLGLSKRLINGGYGLSLRESQDLEIDAQAELLGSPDFQEALASFLERRPGRYRGE